MWLASKRIISKAFSKPFFLICKAFIKAFFLQSIRASKSFLSENDFVNQSVSVLKQYGYHFQFEILSKSFRHSNHFRRQSIQSDFQGRHATKNSTITTDEHDWLEITWFLFHHQYQKSRSFSGLSPSFRYMIAPRSLHFICSVMFLSSSDITSNSLTPYSVITSNNQPSTTYLHTPHPNLPHHPIIKPQIQKAYNAVHPAYWHWWPRPSAIYPSLSSTRHGILTIRLLQAISTITYIYELENSINKLFSPSPTLFSSPPLFLRPKTSMENYSGRN